MAIAGAINILLGLESAKFTAGTNKAVGGLKRFKSEAAGLQSSLGGLNTMLGAFGVGLGLHQTIRFLGDSVAAFEETHKASLKLRGVLEATGGVTGRSAEQIEAMADELERLTTVDDAVIKGGAAVLATFKSLSGDGFDRALRGAIDLAAVMETDVKSAALQLGKALSDPAEGLSALGRAGVKFTEQEQALIQSLVDGGKTIEAQEMILSNLEGKVHGVAESMATDIGKLGTAWDNLKESIGSTIATGEIAEFLKDIAATINVINNPSPETQRQFKARLLGKSPEQVDPLGVANERRKAFEKEIADLNASQPEGGFDLRNFAKEKNPRMREIMRMMLENQFAPDLRPAPEVRIARDIPGAEGDLFPTPTTDVPRGRFINDLLNEGVDRFERGLIRGMEESLPLRQQANIDEANRQPRDFAGFAGGAERGSAEAFQQIAAFKFGNAGQTRAQDMTLEEARKQNMRLEDIHRVLKEGFAQPIDEFTLL